MRPSAALALAVLAACTSRPARPLVFAAVSTSDALSELAGSEVDFSFGSSAALARQIEVGAPADAFLSADAAQMDALVARGLVRKEDVRPLLTNALVVVVPRGSSAVAKPEDLAKLARVALGDPAAKVPAGVYAQRWLEAKGLWPAVAPHVVPTGDVRGALAAVEAGRADAAIVYASDAAIAHGVSVALRVPAAETPGVVYPVAVLAKAPHRAAAEAFVAHLSAPGSRAVFERLGFGVAP